MLSRIANESQSPMHKGASRLHTAQLLLPSIVSGDHRCINIKVTFFVLSTNLEMEKL